jgi:hypothetical protein
MHLYGAPHFGRKPTEEEELVGSLPSVIGAVSLSQLSAGTMICAMPCSLVVHAMHCNHALLMLIMAACIGIDFRSEVVT